MRCLALSLTLVSIAAADPQPAAFIPVDAVVTVQAPDLARSRTRWQRTPYTRLLETGWGRVLIGEWGGRLEGVAPGAGTVLAGVQSLAIAAQATPDDTAPHITIAAAGDAQLPALLTALWQAKPPGGRLATHGQVVAWSSDAAAALQPGAIPPAPGADADLAIGVQPGRWMPAAAEGELRIDLQLDAVGLRETAMVSASAATRLAAQAPRTWADPQELRRLPATTLWAATWQGDPVLAGGLAAQDDSGAAVVESWLAENALPGWKDTVAACSGPATVWMGEGAPFPTLNLALSMREDVARRWIAAATAKLNLAATPDGAAGYLGLLPLAIGWAPEGRLVITSDPQGLACWRAAKPGFADHRGIAEVLTAVPPRTLMLGAGRGGASWATLAQLTVPLFTAMGAPQSVSLPGDLRNAADRGWLHVRLLEDGSVRSESGGLFGGPFTVLAAAGITVPATMWLRNELLMEEQQKRQQKQRREVEAAPTAPVF